jgi:hypothetical protein
MAAVPPGTAAHPRSFVTSLSRLETVLTLSPFQSGE